MSLPSISPDMLSAGSNRFLNRFVSMLGISLSETDYLRGWRDDFLGDFIADQYDVTNTAGAGSTIALVDAFHGGAVRVRAGDDIGRYARLWLGSSAGGYNTLDADSGWVQIARITYSHVTTITYWMGVAITAALNRQIMAGLDTSVDGNWRIYCQNNVGNSTTTSGIAADTNPHWHVIDVYPITGGSQVDYYLDARLLASQTTNVPTDVCTPVVLSYNRGTNIRYADLDFWAVIPR